MTEAQVVNPSRRPTKNEKRRQKKKQEVSIEDSKPNGHNSILSNQNQDISNIEIEYVGADLSSVTEEDPFFAQFRDIFNKFTRPEELMAVDKVDKQADTLTPANEKPSSALTSTTAESQENKPLSKKKKKLLSRLSIAELKQLVPRPDVVEAHDVTSLDPRLLVFLKSYRNTVPVPRHWCHIRKYLQGKRGIEKIPFQLPEYIAETGIARIRDTVLEQEALKKGKQKARDRVRPKMGKIDIDYQVLHDAFFKYQTKPKLTGHGDLYYEGKEFEVHLKEKKPGVLSAELIGALGMTEGAPPPWLVNMQRYGPPPSYFHLRMPGLNAPLPPGAAYGFQPGGWGKPPVDEYGRPLYGDVFGTTQASEQEQFNEQVDTSTRWGVLEVEEEEVEEEEDEEDEEEEEEQVRRKGVDASGMETPSSVDAASLFTGLETPDTIDLRKRTGLETPDTSAPPRELYQVVQERKTTGAALGQVFGSDRGYVLPGKGDVQISLDPDSLEDTIRDKSKLKDAYDAQQSSHTSRDGTETEEDANRSSRKRKAETNPVLRKVKEFKF